MKESLDRRHFLGGAAALAATSGLVACSSEEPPPRPDDVPLSPFGADSTAEEVTQGIDLAGKTALITGCNAGLGLETMRVLAMRGAHVIGAARTTEKAETACASVKGQTSPAVLELTDFDSVVACGDAVRAMGRPLDMLILNAGIMALPELEQVNGLERHFVVNHLGHFVLTNRVIDLVEAAPQGRVVVLSSWGYNWAPESGIEFDNLSGEENYEPNRAYGQSKLANGLFSLELARRLEGTGTTSNSVHPGIINTELGRHMSRGMRLMADLFGWAFMKSVEAGAATTCYVATAPQLAGVTGHYFSDCNAEIPGPRMRDQAMAERLWQVSEELTRDYLA